MKHALKSVLRSFGYDLSRTDREGVDPLIDMQRLMPKPVTIFDVGANVGQSALQYRRAFPSALIHSLSRAHLRFSNFRRTSPIRGSSAGISALGMSVTSKLSSRAKSPC